MESFCERCLDECEYVFEIQIGGTLTTLCEPCCTEVRIITFDDELRQPETVSEIPSGEYVNKHQAARYLSVSARWIEQRMDSIPHIRQGKGKVLFKKSALDTYMEQFRVFLGPDINVRAVRDEVNDALRRLSKGVN